MKFFEFADRNNELSFAWGALICVAICTITIASCDKHNKRAYVAGGYQQVQKQGSTETMWVKK